MAKGGAYFVRGTQNEICNLGGEWKCTAGSKTGQKVLRGAESGTAGRGVCSLHLPAVPACPGCRAPPHPGVRSGVSQWVCYSRACVCEVRGRAGRLKQTEESHWDRPLDTGAPRGGPKRTGVLSLPSPLSRKSCMSKRNII